MEDPQQRRQRLAALRTQAGSAEADNGGPPILPNPLADAPAGPQPGPRFSFYSDPLGSMQARPQLGKRPFAAVQSGDAAPPAGPGPVPLPRPPAMPRPPPPHMHQVPGPYSGVGRPPPPHLAFGRPLGWPQHLPGPGPPGMMGPPPPHAAPEAHHQQWRPRGQGRVGPGRGRGRGDSTRGQGNRAGGQGDRGRGRGGRCASSAVHSVLS